MALSPARLPPFFQLSFPPDASRLPIPLYICTGNRQPHVVIQASFGEPLPIYCSASCKWALLSRTGRTHLNLPKHSEALWIQGKCEEAFLEANSVTYEGLLD